MITAFFAGAEILVGTWLPALNLFESSLRRGKFDESRVLPDGSLMEITKVYPLDAVYDSPEDVPEDIKTNKRYAGSSRWTVKIHQVSAMDNIREGRFGYENLLELMPVASNENANIMPLLSHDDVCDPYYTPAAHIEMPPFPPSLFQQPSLNSYKDYFVETSVPQLQGDMPLLPYSEPEAASGFNLADLSFGTYAPKEKRSSVSNSRELADASKYSRKPRDPIARQRATSADRSRKVKNAEKVEALQKLLPHPKKVEKTEQRA